MSAGAISGAVAPQQVTVNRFAELDSQDFLRVMLAELSNQDPFEPTDSAALMEQMSSLRNIETQLGLQEKLESLVLQNQVTSAGGLIGRTVTGLDASNDSVSGMVTSVQVTGDTARLELDSGASLAVDRVTRIGGDEDFSASLGATTDPTTLVGRLVDGTNFNGVPVRGVVDSVTVADGGPVAHLTDGSMLPVANIASVVDPANPGSALGQLVGREVAYRESDDRVANARVVSVAVDASGIQLTLESGATVPLTDIVSMHG